MISNPKTTRNHQANMDFLSVKLIRQSIEIPKEGITVVLMVCKRDGKKKKLWGF